MTAGRRARRALVLVATLLGAGAAGASRLGAQQPTSPAVGAAGTLREVRGRIVRPVPGGERGVPAVWAVLHRVGNDRAGAVDSVRTGADGAYRFRYAVDGIGDAIWFVSAQYAGIAYFGTPLRAALVDGDDAVITVFDTTSAPVPLRVRGRHLVVSESTPEERRSVIEIFELSNDTTLTRVGGRGDSVTFAVPLPPRADEFAGGQGDVPAEAMALVNGRVEVYAPFAPGVKQLSFTYSLPSDAFPLGIPVERETEVLEVLLEDSTGEATGARLVRQGMVSAEGRRFVRWLADSVPANAVMRVSFAAAPGGLGSQGPVVVVMVVLALAAATLGVMRTVARRRGLYAAPPAAHATEDPERIARRIAALDAQFERRRAPGDEERAAYEAQREALKRALTAALAERDERR